MSLNRGGFTLFEAMLTLTITGVMLVSVIVMFGGQQRKGQFRDAVTDIETRLRDVMNDVSTGYYPDRDIRCVLGPGGTPTFPAGTAEQGTNLSCIYVGKAVQFQEDKLVVYTLVGRRLNATGQPVASFQEAQPVVVPSLTEEYEYLWGIEAYEMYTNTTTARTDSALLIFATTTTTGTISGTNNLESGVQRVTPFVSGSAAGTGVAFTDNSISDAIFVNNGLAWPSGSEVTYCFRNGTGAQSDHRGIEVTGQGLALAVQLEDEAGEKCT